MTGWGAVCDQSVQCKMWPVCDPQPVTDLTSTGRLERDQPVDLYYGVVDFAQHLKFFVLVFYQNFGENFHLSIFEGENRGES